MNLTKLHVKEEFVLTTEQLAKVYGVETRVLRQNFSNNKDRFVEGKHYIKLEGEALKEFKSRVDNIDSVGKRARSLLLWTKKGAARHSKLIGTDEAWDVFEELEETYFAVKESDANKLLMPNFNDPATAARAWADQYDARRLAEAEKECLQIELDRSKEYYSIKRVAADNNLSFRDFSYNLLKRASAEVGRAIKKIFDANYGTVNAYHVDAWKKAYPKTKL